MRRVTSGELTEFECMEVKAMRELLILRLKIEIFLIVVFICTYFRHFQQLTLKPPASSGPFCLHSQN